MSDDDGRRFQYLATTSPLTPQGHEAVLRSLTREWRPAGALPVTFKLATHGREDLHLGLELAGRCTVEVHGELASPSMDRAWTLLSKGKVELVKLKLGGYRVDCRIEARRSGRRL